MEAGSGHESGDAGGHLFHLDRSKLTVLLCDNDPKSSKDILQLLCKCSYQVTTVRTARQVMDFLSTRESDIDIILAEVDLPLAKGLKLLKCITRKKNLRRIPIIMMSSRDEVSVVMKCLRLGAADYLVKPLRTNELLNLWTHTWRRRRMLGRADKDIIFNQDIELILSDPSDVSTKSTTLLSEETDDKTRCKYPEETVEDHKEQEHDTFAMEPVQNIMAEEVNADHAGGMFSWPKKANLKVGQTSAFFTYVKSSTPTRHTTPFSHVHQTDVLNAEGIQNYQTEGNLFPNSENACNSSSSQAPTELPITWDSTEGHVPQMQPMFTVPIFLHGQPSSMYGFLGTLQDLHMQNPASLKLQYNVLSQPHHGPPAVQHIAAYHPAAHQWPLSTDSHVQGPKFGRTARRAEALIKFKQKKKDRCYAKKIRYVNRQRLAEKRTRVRGQFVRQVNDVDTDIQPTDFPATQVYDSEEDEDALYREVEIASSLDRDA